MTGTVPAKKRLEEGEMWSSLSLMTAALGRVEMGLSEARRAGLSTHARGAVLAAGGPGARTLPAEPVPAWLGWLIIGCLVVVTAGVAWALHRSPADYDPGGRLLENPDGGRTAQAEAGVDVLPWDVRAEPPAEDVSTNRVDAARSGIGPHAPTAQRRQQRRERRQQRRERRWKQRRDRRFDVEAERVGRRWAPASSAPSRPIGPDDDEAFLRELDRRIRLERARRERKQGEDSSS